MSIKATIKETKEILERNLVIPDYQRPYRWTTANVLQLLEDIKFNLETGKQEYRIGTAIFYCSKGEQRFNVVDGQQRLTTILLILRNVEDTIKFQAAQTLCYQVASFAAIRANDKFIAKWLHDKTNDNGLAFKEYLLEKCKFADIVVDDLSEAFQMFDTQNGRGKRLELYNLLKAYHIRAMEQNTGDEKIQCDRSWESATQYDATPENPNDPNVDILGQLFREQLFKTRLWCRNENARTFSKDDIGEFKGFTIDKNHPIDFPFQNPFLLQYLTEKFYRNVLAGTIGTKPRFETGDTEKANPFVNINQIIINGKGFFEYIETYVELYKKMFIELGSYQLAEFKRFFFLHCLTYNPDLVGNPAKAETCWQNARRDAGAFRTTDYRTRRTGDTYLREAYKSLCFVLLDKFGEKVFLKYYKPLYRLLYKTRLQYSAIKPATAMSEPTRLFSIVHRAKSNVELLELDEMADGLKNDKRLICEDKMPGAFLKLIREGE